MSGLILSDEKGRIIDYPRLPSCMCCIVSAPHLYFEARVAEETLKNVVLHSLATAFASIVFPVPGGPNSRTPCRTGAGEGSSQAEQGLPTNLLS